MYNYAYRYNVLCQTRSQTVLLYSYMHVHAQVTDTHNIHN